MKSPKATFGVYMLLLTFVALTGCFEKNTKNPIEAYKYWAGEEPPKDIQVLNGQYWESAHWTKEYTIYLELQATPYWFTQLIEQNNLKPDTIYHIPNDAPRWFKPSKNMKVWSNTYCVIIADSSTHHILIFAEQL